MPLSLHRSGYAIIISPLRRRYAMLIIDIYAYAAMNEHHDDAVATLRHYTSFAAMLRPLFSLPLRYFDYV